MAHVSLYRKYRPSTFAEVVGQDHVTTTLAHAVDNETWHHAYLFTGPRGTGKTSSARLLAMALNATEGPTSTPPADDPIVTAIREGTCPDVVEIDAASNNGVDDVRDLRERVAFAPAQTRIKVYIVDECHMLSNAAWNAFLKTIEEPPDHVVFVFATTEPHKVLPTVLSRTQRFDLRRIPAAVLADHCRHIADQEGFTFDGDALQSIVRAGDGSARDTLSVLDQVVAFTGPDVTADGVAQVLGSVPSALLDRMAELLAASDVAGILQLVGDIADSGTDLRQFAIDAVAHLRSLLLLAAAPAAGLVDATPDRVAELRAQAQKTGAADMLRAVELLNDAQPKMRRGNTRLPLEIALAKAALPASGGDPGALAARIDRVEAAARTAPQPQSTDGTSVPQAADRLSPDEEPGQLAEPASPPEVTPLPPPTGPTPTSPPPDAEESPTEKAPDPDPAETPPEPADDLQTVVEAWPAILTTLGRTSRRLQAIVGEGTPVALSDGALVLQFKFDFHAKQAQDPATATAIAQVVQSVVGTHYKVRAVVGADPGDPQHSADAPRSATLHQVDDEASAVLDHEAAEEAGKADDAGAAHDQAIEALTEGLGATVVDDSRG